MKKGKILWTVMMLLGLLVCFAVMAVLAKLENGLWWI